MIDTMMSQMVLILCGWMISSFLRQLIIITANNSNDFRQYCLSPMAKASVLELCAYNGFSIILVDFPHFRAFTYGRIAYPERPNNLLI